ncbi:fumarylacetoacetate hydrolase family protein [Nocardia sp. NPDC101769]|uniref:fumarylacetoacetate hydrolase family protein n=1 Tax=Nocardia sp. NPDC101769 TaxID=3364333 RepID=UPI0038280E13
MRISSIDNRYHVIAGDTAVDIAEASNGRFAPEGFDIYERWTELADWVSTLPADVYHPFGPARVGAPVAMPRQVFAIGLNYRDHAAESNLPEPDAPLVFTKFPTCITGPNAAVTLPSGNVDWEVELVAVIGKRADRAAEDHGWDYVAGLTVGQDLSERKVQLAGPAPQFGLGKSFPGFGPIGPAVVTLDEIPDPGNLAIGCSLGDEVLQKGNTSDLIFAVPELIARISAICPLLPGDVIFTGTPAGVGAARTPQRFLPRDATLVSYVEGLGELRNPLV